MDATRQIPRPPEGPSQPPAAPRHLVPVDWQTMQTLYDLLHDMREVRLAGDAFEMYREVDGGTHIVIPPAAG